MCLIVHKTLEDQPLTKAFVEDVHWNNSDGWGIGIYYPDKENPGQSTLKIYRGIEHKNSPRRLWKLINSNQDKEMIIHFRMRTHGETNEKNVHPFEVAEGVYLMHNGVVDAPELFKAKSDTWHFANNLIKPLLRGQENVSEYIRSKEFKTIIEFLAGTGNRLCVFDKFGVVKFCESLWTKTSSGMCVSNSYAFSVGNSTWGGRGYSGYDQEWYSEVYGVTGHRYRSSYHNKACAYNSGSGFVAVTKDAGKDEKKDEGVGEETEVISKEYVLNPETQEFEEIAVSRKVCLPSEKELTSPVTHIDGFITRGSVKFTELWRGTSGTLWGKSSESGVFERVYDKKEAELYLVPKKSDNDSEADAGSAIGSTSTPDWTGPTHKQPLNEKSVAEISNNIILGSPTDAMKSRQEEYNRAKRELHHNLFWVKTPEDLCELMQEDSNFTCEEICYQFAKINPSEAANMMAQLLYTYYNDLYEYELEMPDQDEVDVIDGTPLHEEAISTVKESVEESRKNSRVVH